MNWLFEAIIFWTTVFLLFHSYLFFPVFMKIISRKVNSEDLMFGQDSPDLPFLSILMAAHNEEKVIAGRIHNLMLSSYPKDKFEIWIGSDNSDDNTNRILSELDSFYDHVHIWLSPKRIGKGNIMNMLIQKAKGDICVFTDANILFKSDTVFQLAKKFLDPQTGIVSGNILSSDVKYDGISYQENTFISLEVLIKYYEGKKWGVTIGAYGGCYAIRKCLYSEIPVNFIVDDFYVTMKVIEKGKRSILEMNAICYEHITNILKEEFRRKVRISSGNFQNLFAFSNLIFQRKPVAFCFISHKVVRWIGPFLLLIAFILNGVLATSSTFYWYLFVFQCLIIFIPFLDFFLRKIHIHIIILRFITHFYSMNLALAIGFLKFLKGVNTNVWEPTNREQ